MVLVCPIHSDVHFDHLIKTAPGHLLSGTSLPSLCHQEFCREASGMPTAFVQMRVYGGFNWNNDTMEEEGTYVMKLSTENSYLSPGSCLDLRNEREGEANHYKHSDVGSGVMEVEMAHGTETRQGRQKAQSI